MIKAITTTILLFFFQYSSLFAQIDRVEPLHWWTGMNNPELQLMIYGDNVGAFTSVSVDKNFVRVNGVHSADSPNYLFVDLIVTKKAKPGKLTFTLTNKNQNRSQTFEFELKNRAENSAQREGFNSSDAIYLITPDRFANGDPSNDVIDEMLETNLNRMDDFARHGGDIRGIINHLDYIKNMGFTAMWITPLLENDMPRQSYHGYAITDLYKNDPRFGTNELYQELAKEMRKRDMKLIMDQVLNHIGSNHWWMDDLPFDNWLNYQGEEELHVTNHTRQVYTDPYASEIDNQKMQDGWFVSTMPDMNQRNPFLATYLIQNSIWWIEYADLGGIRIDTYSYPNPEFTAKWTKAIINEYPKFNMVGEEWSTQPSVIAKWQKGYEGDFEHKQELGSLMDFPLQEALVAALVEEDNSWANGLIKLYQALSMDFNYADASNLVIFPDNHDMDRIFTSLGEDVNLQKMALTYLSTMRGIPQVYYGTEIGMENTGFPHNHGVIRTDFPGGWYGDEKNVFTGENLKPFEEDLIEYTKTMLNWRKTSEAVHNGDLLHFAPVDAIYVYFRLIEDEKVMVVMNKNEDGRQLDSNYYQQGIGSASRATNIFDQTVTNLSDGLTIPGKSAVVFELE